MQHLLQIHDKSSKAKEENQFTKMIEGQQVKQQYQSFAEHEKQAIIRKKER